MSLRRFRVDVRLEHLTRLVAERLRHYNGRGFSLNEALRRVPQECEISVEWAYINGKLVVGQWYVMKILRNDPGLLPELAKQELIHIWR